MGRLIGFLGILRHDWNDLRDGLDQEQALGNFCELRYAYVTYMRGQIEPYGTIRLARLMEFLIFEDLLEADFN